MDRNVLVQRGALDIVSVLFPFHQSFLLLTDLTCILTAAMHTLLKRDVSLSRRLYGWLLGTQVDKSALTAVTTTTTDDDVQSPPFGNFPASSFSSSSGKSEGHLLASQALPLDVRYFEKYSKKCLVLSLHSVTAQARGAVRLGLSKTECVLPYRMLRALQEQPKMGDSVLASMMLELASCLKDQIDWLGGVTMAAAAAIAVFQGSKENNNNMAAIAGATGLKGKEGGGSSRKSGGKRGSLKADIIQSANLLFNSLSRDSAVWEWMEAVLAKSMAEPVRWSAAAAKHWRRTERRRIRSTEAQDSVEKGSSKEVLAGGGGGGREKPSIEEKLPSLESLLALFMFLVQIIPKVSITHTLL